MSIVTLVALGLVLPTAHRGSSPQPQLLAARPRTQIPVACATEPPAGDTSLAATIVIILAIAVSLLCPLGLLIWYLRLPAERRAAMWNARLEVIGAAPKATAAA